jgi:nicotinate-nucleotide adenylyltransferase
VKVALFGGTFDPIHRGHIEVARAAADAYQLDRVLFVPAGRPPHKPRPTEASYEHRYRMVEIACRADGRFVASRLEDPRNDSDRHYSIDTIEQMLGELEAGDRLYFVIGADAFAEINLWRRWEDVASKVEFIVVSRPGVDRETLKAPAGARVNWLEDVKVPVSSTEVREAIRNGAGLPDGLPGEVGAYIRANELYGVMGG